MRHTLHECYQWNRQERHEHHQLEIVDEGYGFRLHGHHLGQGGGSAEGDKIELVSVSRTTCL
jgi:hypothetical protein